MFRSQRSNAQRQNNSVRKRPSLKRVKFGMPRKEKRIGAQEIASQFVPPEDWYESTDNSDSYRIIEQSPGNGYRHILSAAEIIDRLNELPSWMLEDLEVVQLSRMTRKKQLLPCYGMQWGSALYLYPVEEDLVEYFDSPPTPALMIDTKMYGGKWHQDGNQWRLTWSEATIKDYYLNNILIHELGHLLDDRNRSYQDRERYAEWFAIRYGYLPSRDQVQSRPKKRVRKRHHRR